jgi:N-acetyl-anhydromuramyl-L-alanine amidase AmpD
MDDLVSLASELKAMTKKLSELTHRFKKHSNQLELEQLQELCVYAEFSRAQSQLLAHLIKNIIETHIPY